MVAMTLPAVKPTGFESDYDDLQAQLKRRRLQAAALQNQDLGLGAQMVSGHLVAAPWMEALGKIAQSGIGSYNQSLLDDEERALNKQKQDEFAQLATQFPRATPGQPATMGMLNVDDEGNKMPVAPEILPKKPEAGDYINFASKLARFGAMGQAAAGHMFNRVIDAEMPTKAEHPEYVRGADTAGPDGKPVATYHVKGQPWNRVNAETVYEKPDELQKKVDMIYKAYKTSPEMSGVSDESLRTTAELMATGNWELTPPNNRGEVALVNKMTRVRMTLPGAPASTGGAQPPVQTVQQTVTPEPVQQTAPPPAPMQSSMPMPGEEGPPPPLIPAPPAQAATPPLIPKPYKTNFTGTADQIARMNALAEADARAEAAKAAVKPTAPAPVASAPVAAPVANKPLSAMTAKEKWDKYGGHSGNLDYLEPKPQPGIDIAGGVPGSLQSERMNTALEKIVAAREKKALAEQEQIMKEFDTAVAGIAKNNPEKGVRMGDDGEWTGAAPGQGYGKFNPLKDKPTQAMSQAKQSMDDILIKARAGSAVSQQEADRISVEVGSAFLQGPEAFWQAIKNTRARIEAANREILRPYPPIVKDAWRESRSGGFVVGAPQ